MNVKHMIKKVISVAIIQMFDKILTIFIIYIINCNYSPIQG